MGLARSAGRAAGRFGNAGGRAARRLPYNTGAAVGRMNNIGAYAYKRPRVPRSPNGNDFLRDMASGHSPYIGKAQPFVRGAGRGERGMGEAFRIMGARGGMPRMSSGASSAVRDLHNAANVAREAEKGLSRGRKLMIGSGVAAGALVLGARRHSRSNQNQYTGPPTGMYGR